MEFSRRVERAIAHGSGPDQRGAAPLHGAGSHGRGRDGADVADAGGRQCCEGDASGEPASASERGPIETGGGAGGVDCRGDDGHIYNGHIYK